MGALRRTLLASIGCAVTFAVVPSATAAPALLPTATGARVTAGVHHPGPYRPDVSTVTLITGDRVRLTRQPDGTTSAVPIAGPHRSAMVFSVRQRGSSVEVVPADAAALVRTGRVDSRLFEVAGLVAAGYDDRKAGEIPLVLHHRPGGLMLPKGAHVSAAPRTAATPSGSSSAVATTKVATSKKDAGAFWRWLTTSSGRDVQKVSLGGRRTTPVARHASAATPASARGVVDQGMYNLTIRLTDRNGRLVNQVDDAFLTPPVVGNRDTEETFPLHPVAGGLGARVPGGRYFFGEILATSHGIAKPKSFTHLAMPVIDLTRDTTVALDARTAKPVRATVNVADPQTVFDDVRHRRAVRRPAVDHPRQSERTRAEPVVRPADEGGHGPGVPVHAVPDRGHR